MDTKFQTWLMENQPSDNMLYKNNWWEQYIFWRDYILPMFASNEVKNYDNFDKWAEEINKNTEIVGTHMSKSIIHPCVKITYRGVDIVFRYNFYDYEVAVVGDVPIYLPMFYRMKQDASFYFQGFPTEYKLEKKYNTKNNKEFVWSTINRYDFYTFMVLVKDCIDRNRMRNKE